MHERKLVAYLAFLDEIIAFVQPRRFSRLDKTAQGQLREGGNGKKEVFDVVVFLCHGRAR